MGTIGLSAARGPVSPCRRARPIAPVAVGATSLNGSPHPCGQAPQSVTGAHDIVTAISAAGGGATVTR